MPNASTSLLQIKILVSSVLIPSQQRAWVAGYTPVLVLLKGRSRTTHGTRDKQQQCHSCWSPFHGVWYAVRLRGFKMANWWIASFRNRNSINCAISIRFVLIDHCVSCGVRVESENSWVVFPFIARCRAPAIGRIVNQPMSHLQLNVWHSPMLTAAVLSRRKAFSNFMVKLTLKINVPHSKPNRTVLLRKLRYML
jgi:hypothetical protein